MKNDRLLTFSVFGFVVLMHAALFALLLLLNSKPQLPDVEDMEFVDLAAFGPPGGGGGGAPAAAPAPAQPQQAEPQPEPEKPKPKPPVEKPKPVVKEPEKPKLKPVITHDRKADIRIPKEEKPEEKIEPKPQPKPEPKPEPKPAPPAPPAPVPAKKPEFTAPGGTGSGEGQGTDPKAHGKPGSTGTGGGRGGGDGMGDGPGTGSGRGPGSGGGSGGGDGAGGSAGNAIVKAGGRLATPSYPPLSVENGETGTIVMEVLVDPSGRATEVKITKGSGYARLDAAAKRGAMSGHYQTHGKWVRFKGAKIVFELND